MKRNKLKRNKIKDVIKAIRRGEREAAQELLGPGFHSVSRPYRSKKNYTRKVKHKKMS